LCANARRPMVSRHVPAALPLDFLRSGSDEDADRIFRRKRTERARKRGITHPRRARRVECPSSERQSRFGRESCAPPRRRSCQR
jgi:hypothetical protein